MSASCSTRDPSIRTDKCCNEEAGCSDCSEKTTEFHALSEGLEVEDRQSAQSDISTEKKEGDHLGSEEKKSRVIDELIAEGWTIMDGVTRGGIGVGRSAAGSGGADSSEPMMAAPSYFRGIDDELSWFTHVLSSLRASGDITIGRIPPPDAVVDVWDRMLNSLDIYLDKDHRNTQAVKLVRIRVTIENELYLSNATWIIPGYIYTRVRSRLAILETLVHTAVTGSVPIPEGDIQPLIEWPVEPVVVTSSFGWRRHPIHGRAAFHYGIDLRAYLGQVVTAAGDGVVFWADWKGGHGRHVEIRHSDGWVTRYSHLSMILVEVGDRLRAGDAVGLAGQTGNVTGTHLHFEVWQNDDVHDPVEILGEPAGIEWSEF